MLATTLREQIIQTIMQVSEEQNKALAPLSDDLPLLDSGMDSLCIAIVVAMLEDQLGVDPLTDTQAASLPVTLGDFICLYENAAR
jgi:acyl carrier protein